MENVPELELIQNERIKVVEEMKIVGYILKSDFKTWKGFYQKSPNPTLTKLANTLTTNT